MGTVVPVVVLVRLYAEVEVAAAEVRPVPSAGVVESFQSEDGTSASVAWRSQDRLQMLAAVSQTTTTVYL